MTAISIETAHQFTKATPLFAAMGPIALASIKVELVRVMVVCSVGIKSLLRETTLHTVA
jgi:hypothetical protein